MLTNEQKTYLGWSAVGVVLLLALWSLGPVLSPFVVAAVLAYALNPLVDRLVRSGLARFLAVLLVETVFILAVLGVVLLIIPILAKELPQVREQLPDLLEKLNANLQPLLKQVGVDFSLDIASIKQLVLNYVSSNAEESWATLLSSLKLGSSVALQVLGNLILIPVALFYMLMSWRKLVASATTLIPRRLHPTFDSFVTETDDVLGQYLRGQLLVMVLLAVYYALGLRLFGLELALPIGVFTGLAVFVPYVGFGLGLLLATTAGLLQFASTGPLLALIMVAVVYGLGQLIESFVLTPRLVGERIGLHPLAVIFALMAFGQVFGFVGVLVALPASAVLLVAGRRLRAQYLASEVYRDQV
jgi:predicted PurR-regulated permease PerM